MEDLLNDVYVEQVLAKKRRRWFAAAIDHIILVIVFAVIVYAFGKGEMDENGNVSYGLTGLPAFLAAVVPWLLIIPCMEAWNDGQTIGKALLGVRAVRDDGSRINFSNAILRHILDFADNFPFLGIVGLIVASNNKQQKRIGDQLGKTIIIEARKKMVA